MTLTFEQALKHTDRLYDRLSKRRPEIEKNLRYFRGDHSLTFASKEWRKQHEAKYRNFSDNWCGVVGSAPAERTEIKGFRLDDNRGPASKDEKQLWRDWEINEGPAQSSQGFLTSTIAKRSMALVWGDEDGEPVMTWEDPAQAIVDYDVSNPRIRRYALKAWLEGDDEYATLYDGHALYKLKRPRVATNVVNGRTESGLYIPSTTFSGSSSWVAREPEETGDDAWPLPNPLGVVPMVEFPNRPMLGGEPLSDIAGTMSMQDAINLLWAYLFTQADFAGMPARVVTGADRPMIPILDDNGQRIGEKPLDIEELGRTRFAWLPKDAKVDQWEAAKFDAFTQVINIAVRHVSAQTRTPIYLVHGELGNVNGETLTGLDAPLVSKVGESHKFYRSPVREVFRLFALVRGDLGVAEACRTGNVQWASAEVRSDAQVSDAALKDRQIGWPMRSVLAKRYGLSPTEIDDVMADVKDERMSPYLTKLDAKEQADADADAAVGGV